MSDTTTAEAYRNNRVGPVLRASPLTAAVIEAAEEDNPDKTIRVDDKVAYVRFASVYLEFKSLEEFLTELHSLLKKEE